MTQEGHRKQGQAEWTLHKARRGLLQWQETLRWGDELPGSMGYAWGPRAAPTRVTAPEWEQQQE